MKSHLIPVLALILISCNDNSEKPTEENKLKSASLIPFINYNVINVFPHDTTSFTEGLLFHENRLFESTGYTEVLPNTRSLFGEVDLKTGSITPRAELDKTKYFGEGICFLNDKVYQLTYKTKIGFIYDAKTFKRIGDFSFPSEEGWGMTTDSINLIMSDGTNIITFLEPLTMNAVKKLNVTVNKQPVVNINELEYFHGFIYANIYATNIIVKIDPADGNVIGMLDLGPIKNEQKNKYTGSLEMNGVAFDPLTGSLYITGKMWPNIYEIRLSP